MTEWLQTATEYVSYVKLVKLHVGVSRAKSVAFYGDSATADRLSSKLRRRLDTGRNDELCYWLDDVAAGRPLC